MAGYDLIDDYLRSLRGDLSWRADAAEIDEELRDHLYSATERLELAGISRITAQRRVLSRFGRPSAIVASFATSGSRGLALPTARTIRAGQFGTIAGPLWGAAGSLWMLRYLLGSDALSGWRLGYGVNSVGVVLASLFSLVLIAGLNQRHGGLGVAGRFGIAVASIGVAASLLSWFFFGWALLLGVGSLIMAVGVLERGLAPRLPTIVFGASWLFAFAVAVVMRLSEIGARDAWGDYPLGTAVAVLVGSLGSAVGAIGLGRWLASELPAEPHMVDAPNAV